MFTFSVWRSTERSPSEAARRKPWATARAERFEPIRLRVPQRHVPQYTHLGPKAKTWTFLMEQKGKASDPSGLARSAGCPYCDRASRLPAHSSPPRSEVRHVSTR